MKKLLMLALGLNLALCLIPTKSEAHYFHAPVAAVVSPGFAFLPFLVTVAGFAVVPLNVYGVDPWHPLAKRVWGDKGVVEYSYPKGRNGA